MFEVAFVSLVFNIFAGRIGRSAKDAILDDLCKYIYFI